MMERSNRVLLLLLSGLLSSGSLLWWVAGGDSGLSVGRIMFTGIAGSIAFLFCLAFTVLYLIEGGKP